MNVLSEFLQFPELIDFVAGISCAAVIDEFNCLGNVLSSCPRSYRRSLLGSSDGVRVSRSVNTAILRDASTVELYMAT